MPGCHQAPISSFCTLPRDQKPGLFETLFSDGRSTGFSLREVLMCSSAQPSSAAPGYVSLEK